MFTPNSRRFAWIGAALALLLLAWTLLGFLFVPWYAQRELPRLMAEERSLDLRIGELKFNPFTLVLRAADVSLRERSGQPLLGFAAATADLEWRSLVRGAWVLSEVSLTAPAARVQISEDGRLNLAALLPREPSAGTPKFAIGRLALQGGRVEFEDRREGYRNQIEQIALELSSLSTDEAAGGGYTLSARSASGAKLDWKGELSLAALSLSGVLTVQDAQLAEFTPYLDDVAALRIGSGVAAMELPYRLTLPGGKPQFEVKGGKFAVRDLALMAAPAQGGVTGAKAAAVPASSVAFAQAPLAKVQSLRMEGVDFDLAARRMDAQTLAVGGVSLEARRGADGTLDLARLLARPATAAVPSPATAPPPAAAPTAVSAPWQAAIAAVEIDGVAVRYADATAKTPVAVVLDGLSARLMLELALDGQGVRAAANAGELSLAKLTLSPAASTATGSAAQPAVALGALAIKAARFDTTTNILEVATARVGSLSADAVLRQDRLSLLDLLPAIAASPAGDAIIMKKKAPASASSTRPFIARIKALEIADGAINVSDEASGIAVALVGVKAKLGDLASDSFTSTAAGVPLQFEANAGLKSGGRLALRGRAVPGTGAVDARVEAAGVSLALLQPLLARRASVKLVSGEASLAGALTLGGSTKAKTSFSGSAAAGNVVLEDSTGVRLVEWKSLATDSLRLAWPDQLDIDELRVVAPAARFAIAKDGSSNLSRAFARKDGTAAAGPATPTAATAPASGAVQPAQLAQAEPPPPAMAVNIRRLRVDQGALDFSDDNISPGFVAKVHELAGTANGLSTDRETRSQFAFEGRVDEFGYARLSGSINAFAPRDRTTFRVQMRNIDLARVSPYSIKFAGYRIASGRMDMDLNYRLRANLIEGDNRLTLQQFTLGDKVDSPDAFKLPLELAVALLKDADGRIELELPVTGSLDDPQFSIAPLVWKAIGNLVGSIITAPFRALGRLFGGSGGGEDMGNIGFEPGAARLLPPEREKIQRVVEAMGKRPELKLAIPARFDTLADARALRRDALARDIGRRAGYAIADGETPGPVNTDDRATRAALRALFAERFSPAELDRLKAEAEAKAAKGGDAGGGVAAGAAGAKPALLERLRNLAAGEPQVVDAREFYATLLRRLRDAQPLPPGALAELGEQRAAAIESALRAAGTDAGRLARTAAPSSSDAEARQVSVSLSVSAR